MIHAKCGRTVMVDTGYGLRGTLTISLATPLWY